MHYNALSQTVRFEKTKILADRIIANALQSERGDVIRAMNASDLEKMIQSVNRAVHNILAEETRRGYDYTPPFVIEDGHVIVDTTARFEPRPDVEIEEEVTAYFEIDGKLQCREVETESFITLPGIDESVEGLMLLMKIGGVGMQYDPFSVSDRLERADSLTNNAIMNTLQREEGVDIRAMSYAEYKLMRKDVFSGFYHELAAEAEEEFEQACEDYVPEWDGIENDPRKKFKPKTKFEIDQEIKAYFKEQGMLH